MYCSISGEVPQQPVVSRLSGHLFERRLIEKHLQEHSSCPITGQDMTLDDLLEMQVNKAVKPRAVTATSIPGMLTMFQNEWDELMLETFTLKQNLDATRQELSQALYQHDAACRVIARLMRERDEARNMLSTLAAQGVDTSSSQEPPSENDSKMEVSENGGTSNPLGEKIMSVLSDTCAELSKSRKARKSNLSPHLATREDISAGCEPSREASFSVTPHASSKPGVHCLAMCQTASGDVALTGGADKMAFLTDVSNGKVISKLSGHSKKVSAVALHSSSGHEVTAFTASADHSVKVWRSGGDGYSAVTTFSGQHEEDIHSLCLHPSGEYVMSVSADNSWSFLDVGRGESLLQVRSEQSGEKFTCGELHPDGLILSCGASSGAVRLWDIREQKNVASLGEGEGKEVSSLSFNQNGYLLAAGGLDGVCRVWDLRKLKSVASLSSSSSKPVSCVQFDFSGGYLAVGDATGAVDFSVVKEWTCLATLHLHKKAVTGLSWGTDASFLLSSSLDRCIKKQMFKE